MACCDPGGHDWVLRSTDFEDLGAVNVFECRRCGAVDFRDVDSRTH